MEALKGGGAAPHNCSSWGAHSLRRSLQGIHSSEACAVVELHLSTVPTSDGPYPALALCALVCRLVFLSPASRSTSRRCVLHMIRTNQQPTIFTSQGSISPEATGHAVVSAH
jgi:hypothetical protein